jgi:hypothetical protein
VDRTTFRATKGRPYKKQKFFGRHTVARMSKTDIALSPYLLRTYKDVKIKSSSYKSEKLMQDYLDEEIDYV